MAGQNITGFGDLTQDVVDAINAGGGGSDAESIWTIPIDGNIPDLADFDGVVLQGASRQNFLAENQNYSLTPWTLTAGTAIDVSTGKASPVEVDGDIIDFQGIVCPAVSQQNYTNQSVTVVAGKAVFQGWYEKGASDWIRIILPSGVSAYFDLANCAIGSSPAGVDDYEILSSGAACYIRMEVTFAGTTGICRVYPALADNNANITGDGSTVETYLQGLEIKEGTLENTREAPYTPTTTTADTGSRVFKVQQPTPVASLENVDTGVIETPQNSVFHATTPTYHKYISPVQGDNRGTVYRIYWGTNHALTAWDELFPISHILPGNLEALSGSQYYANLPRDNNVCEFRRQVSNNNLVYVSVNTTLNGGWIDFIE